MDAVSSCLLGVSCRYNGSHCLSPQLQPILSSPYLSICPEVLGGLSTPRPPCEIVGGSSADVLAGKARIFNIHHQDMTSVFLFGAKKALQLCTSHQVTKAYLKSNSPTCGFGHIYDGTFSSTLQIGNGIFAELLMQNGIKVISIDPLS